MNLLHFAGRLYSLDALDSRFTTSSEIPPSRIDPARPSANELQHDDSRKSVAGDRLWGAPPSRWRTPEFMVYGLVILIAVPWMFKTVYDVSQPSHPNYSKFASLLSEGWIPGRMVDNSDSQYASFRDNVPYLFIVMILHPLLRRSFDFLYPVSSRAKGSQFKEVQDISGSSLGSEMAKADDRLDQRITFDVCFSILFLVALHGFSAAKVLAILYGNYLLATRLKKKYVPVATWVCNIGILFANEMGNGYAYETIANSILPSSILVGDSSKQGNWGSFLDSYGGLIPRWEILFNVTVLRLISFNFDYYWSLDQSSSSAIEVCQILEKRNLPKKIKNNTDNPKKKQTDPSSLSERDRISTPSHSSHYSFLNYLAYTVYPPLYLAGPILTFNDYISQTRHPAPSINLQQTLFYGLRFLLALLSMELMIHYIYVVAISKAQPAWEVYTPFQLSMLGYFNLHHIWLKLLLPWRFFRLWALLDGIDPPENMVRCMSDNYSAFAFWRGWHRSFNRWIIRYIYMPLGGTSHTSKYGILRSIANMLIVFTFVALWHDIQLRLLVWGWLITLFVLPELLAGYAFPKKKWEGHKEAYGVICGVGAVGNILMMMAANLVGFAVGLDGLKGLVQGIVGSYSGLAFLAAACVALFTGVQVMFELRAQEMRQGFNAKC